MTVHTWWPLHHTCFRLLVKDMVVEFLSNDLKFSKAFFFSFSSFVSIDLYRRRISDTRMFARPVVRGTSLSCRQGKVC